MLKFKKVVVFMAMLLVVIVSITYSRMVSFGNINTSSNVALWAVKINGKDVSSSSSFSLNNLVPLTNNKVANGYLAPSGKGYFTIELDTTGTQVAVDYTIGLDLTTFEDYPGISIEKVTIDEGEGEKEISWDNGYFDGYIPLADVLNNKKINFKIYVIWNEIDDETDTTHSLDYGEIAIPIIATIKQHLDNDNTVPLVSQLVPYKETLFEVERPSSLIINPYYDSKFDALYKNPERGFYNSNFIFLSESGNTTKDMHSTVSNLLYLKVDLSAFAKSRNGSADIPLTRNALETLDQQLNIIKEYNNQVILRFVYDNGATTYDSSITKYEPEQDMLLTHIKQMAGVNTSGEDNLGYNLFTKYSTTIYTIQIGFYGLWGESYYSTDVNSHPEYYTQTGNVLLEVTDGTDITIAFRRLQYCSELSSDRIGMFNDAYLSQDDDMGTFIDRDSEVAWLNSKNYVSYGGEALPASSSEYSNWDLISYTEGEMFKTHTSYLNFEWNQNKHYIWANQNYDGNDSLYKGKSAFEYIQAHLGYRLVLKNVELPRTAEKQTAIPLNISIENVGFGNVIKSKSATLLFIDSSDTVISSLDISSDFNIKDFTSKNKITKNMNITLPDLPDGNYKIYLRISNELLADGTTYHNAIRLANNIWDNSLQANKIGNIKIVSG